MDPNEQEADQKLMQAEEVEATAENLENQGNAQTSSILEETATELRETAEQQKIDTESQINEANVDEHNRTQARQWIPLHSSNSALTQKFHAWIKIGTYGSERWRSR